MANQPVDSTSYPTSHSPSPFEDKFSLVPLLKGREGKEEEGRKRN
jgi:hypothetical protein